MSEVYEYIDKHFEEFVSDLIEFLRIPSISTEPEHYPDCARAAEGYSNRLHQLGFDAQLLETKLNPVVYAHRMLSPEAPTVLFYGHYDVQPPDPLELWQSDPFDPAIRNGSIYARGASDDKGQSFIHLKAIESIVRSTDNLPVNVKFVIEGEEEIGSPNFVPFVRENGDLLKSDCVVVSDTSMWKPGLPGVARSLRGLTALEVRVKGPDRDLHSGTYGGAVPNPIQILAQMLAKLHDDKGRILVPGFYDEVLELTQKELDAIEELEFDEDAFREDLKLKALWGDDRYSVLERRWTRPTIEINGISGGYQGNGVKTVIPSIAGAKVSMRLVPEQNPKRAFQAVESYLKSICPGCVEMSIEDQGGTAAVLLPLDTAVVRSASKAVKEVFGQEPVQLRFGGSIPVVNAFVETLKTSCLVLGFGLPDDNLHSPNEKFNLENFRLGIHTIVRMIEDLASC